MLSACRPGRILEILKMVIFYGSTPAKFWKLCKLILRKDLGDAGSGAIVCPDLTELR